MLGAGGHAQSVEWASHAPVAGWILPDADGASSRADHLTESEALAQLAAGEVAMLNGIGFVGGTNVRRIVFEVFSERGFTFPAVVHASALVAPSATLGAGAQVLAGAIVGPSARIGNNVIVNTGAIVEHGCSVGEHSHISTGAVLCGDATIGTGAMIGAGSVILPGRSVANDAIVGAGATVVNDADGVVVGTPARGSRQ